MQTYFNKISSHKIAICFGFFLAILISIQFIPSETEAGGGGGGGGGIEIGPINIDLGDLVDVNGNPINPAQPPPAITATGGGQAEWCWGGTCWTGTDQEALDFVTYYLGLIVGEFGTVTGSTILYDDAGRVIYIACVNGGIVNVTYSDPAGTNDLCPADAGVQTSLSECSCTPINSCADTTCNTTTCYNGCATVTGTMDCSLPQSATLSASPATINVGDSSTLSYSCSPAAPASILPTVGAISGGAPVTTGSVSVSPLTNTTYTLTCFGTTNATAPATVTVNAACVAFAGQPCNPANICGMTNSGTYDCAGTCSVVAPADALCPVNTNPNAPTITGPVSANNGVSSVFTLSATDANGDAIYYQVDWGNDGTPDETTATVASGVSQNVNHLWSTNGTYTFAARAVDTSVAPSAWTSHTIVISSPPSVSLQGRINSNPPSGADKTMNPGDTVTLSWTSTNAVSCTGSPAGFNTGGATNNNVGVSVTPPAPGTSLTYTISCSGPGGSVTEDIIVTTNQLSNLTTPVGIFDPSTTVDPLTGNYTSAEVRFQTTNNGESDTVNTVNYTVEIDYGNDGTTPFSVDATQTGTITNLAKNGNYNGSETFTNVPFGNYKIRITVDSDYDVAEVDEGDNVWEPSSRMLAPTAPNLQLTVDQSVVREGQTVNVSWNTGATYSMNCTISGPALTAYSFNPNVNGATGSRTTTALSSKSEYLLSCTEPITNTTFTESASVEIVPTAEEV